MKRMMKCLVSTMLAALTLLAAMPAMAEEGATLQGLVLRLEEEGFILDDEKLDEVYVTVDDSTLWDGVLIEEDVQVGMYVIVKYDGRTTRSLPPQAHADKVGCYRLTGEAAWFSTTGVMLTGDETFGDVLVRVPEDAPHIFMGVPMTVYYNGVMAMSYPGQVGALHIDVPVVTGTAEDVDEQGFTLVSASGERIRVNIDQGTLMRFDDDWDERQIVKVYYRDMTEVDGVDTLTALEVSVEEWD